MCDGRCSSRRCSVAFREQYSLQVSLEHGQRRWRRDEIWQTVPHSRRGHGKGTVADSGQPRWRNDESGERVLTLSAGAAAYRGQRHAGSRWRGTVAQCHGDSGKREQRACTQSAVPPSANAALAEFPYLGSLVTEDGIPYQVKQSYGRRSGHHCKKYGKVTACRFRRRYTTILKAL